MAALEQLKTQSQERSPHSEWNSLTFTGSCLLALIATTTKADKLPSPDSATLPSKPQPVAAEKDEFHTQILLSNDQQSQHPAISFDFRRFGFNAQAQIQWEPEKQRAALHAIIKDSAPGAEDTARLTEPFIRAHYSLMKLEEALAESNPKCAEALQKLRRLGLHAIQSGPQDREEAFNRFFVERTNIAEEYKLLVNIGIGLGQGFAMHEHIALPVHGSLELHRDGQRSTILFVSEPSIAARGYTAKDLAVINMAKADLTTDEGRSAFAVTILDELAHVYLSQHLRFDSYYELPWDTEHDGRPNAPDFIRSEQLRKALQEMPVKNHQHVDELVAFSWSVQAENHLGIDTAVATLLSFEGHANSPEVRNHRYYTITRITDIALQAIDETRGGELKLAEKYQQIAEAREKIDRALSALGKLQVINMTRDIVGSDAPEELRGLKDVLITDLPAPETARQIIQEAKSALNPNLYKAADMLLNEYTNMYGLLPRIAGSEELATQLMAKDAEQHFREQGDAAQKEWSALLRKLNNQLLATLTTEEREQIAETIVCYGSYYEEKIRQHYEKNIALTQTEEQPPR